MLTHVVLFRLADPDARADELVDRLRALPAQIPEIQGYDAGRDVSRGSTSYDVGLLSTFDDADALERYRVHPAHQDLLRFVEEVSTERVVADWLS